MVCPRPRIGSDVLTFETTRRPGWRCGGTAAIAAALAAATLALTACGPEEQSATARVADAEGTTVGQAAPVAPEAWTGTGAYLAGITAFDNRDMKTAADLLVLAL